MNKQILEEKIYYYEDGVKNFETLMKTIDELDALDKEYGKESWLDWTASNDKNFIYGKTKSFDIEQINNITLDPDYKEKMKYVYNTIMESFHEVCSDYAKSIGDNDEPRLFPTFNIKKYRSGIGMGSHFDQNDGDTTLRYSFNIYLNDDFDGGQTYVYESNKKRVDIQPKPGRLVAYNGHKLEHGVAKVTNGLRYTLPIWYTIRPQDLPKSLLWWL
jgi:hypothetical protein